ncbi:hypothetical protein OIU78_029893 [Salix suchowensis]|nr:hypothetical protein OIU78_029893 [Salix suchowensis]
MTQNFTCFKKLLKTTTTDPTSFENSFNGRSREWRAEKRVVDSGGRYNLDGLREGAWQREVESRSKIHRWSLIAGRIPGRTDNQVKNHWNIHLSKKLGVKGKYKVSDSSSEFSKKPEADFSIKSSSNDRSIPSNKTEAELQNVLEGSHEKAKEITSTQEPILTSDFYDPYLYAPSLMELLDESLDFLWHDF